MDEARIWNVARLGRDRHPVDDEPGAGLSAPGLVGRWGLSEGSGTVSSHDASPASASVHRENHPGPAPNLPTWASRGPSPRQPAGDGRSPFRRGDQYVTFGAAARHSARRTSPSRRGSGRHGGRYTEEHRVAAASRCDPDDHEGAGRDREPANVNMNYFLGIDARRRARRRLRGHRRRAEPPGLPVDDLTDRDTTPGTTRPAGPTTGTTWRLYLDGNLEVTEARGENATPTAWLRPRSSEARSARCLTHPGPGRPVGFFAGRDSTNLECGSTL